MDLCIIQILVFMEYIFGINPFSRICIVFYFDGNISANTFYKNFIC